MELEELEEPVAFEEPDDALDSSFAGTQLPWASLTKDGVEGAGGTEGSEGNIRQKRRIQCYRRVKDKVKDRRIRSEDPKGWVDDVGM